GSLEIDGIRTHATSSFTKRSRLASMNAMTFFIAGSLTARPQFMERDGESGPAPDSLREGGECVAQQLFERRRVRCALAQRRDRAFGFRGPEAHPDERAPQQLFAVIRGAVSRASLRTGSGARRRGVSDGWKLVAQLEEQTFGDP